MHISSVDTRTRTYLLDEFQRDVNAGRLHVPSELTKAGAVDWPVLLQLALMESGPEALARHLRERGRMDDPGRAHALAHRVLRRLFGRAICRQAIDDGVREVEVMIESMGGAVASRRRVDPISGLEALRAATDACSDRTHRPSTLAA